MIVILLILYMIAVAVVTGIGEAHRLKDARKYSALWHNCKLGSWIGFLLLGFNLGFYSDVLGFEIHNLYLSSLLWIGLFAIIFFIIHDGIINVITYDRNFFYVSTTTTAITEPIAHWWIKIPLLLIVSLLNIFLRKKTDEK